MHLSCRAWEAWRRSSISIPTSIARVARTNAETLVRRRKRESVSTSDESRRAHAHYGIAGRPTVCVAWMMWAGSLRGISSDTILCPNRRERAEREPRTKRGCRLLTR